MTVPQHKSKASKTPKSGTKSSRRSAGLEMLEDLRTNKGTAFAWRITTSCTRGLDAAAAALPAFSAAAKSQPDCMNHGSVR